MDEYTERVWEEIVNKDKKRIEELEDKNQQKAEYMRHQIDRIEELEAELEQCLDCCKRVGELEEKCQRYYSALAMLSGQSTPWMDTETPSESVSAIMAKYALQVIREE